MRGLSALLSHFFWMILLPNIKMKHYLLMFPLCSSSISLPLQIIRQHQTALMTVAARAGAALLFNPVVLSFECKFYFTCLYYVLRLCDMCELRCIAGSQKASLRSGFFSFFGFCGLNSILCSKHVFGPLIVSLGPYTWK